MKWREKDGPVGCTIAVLGMARTGRAAAAVLMDRGARILAYDGKDVSDDPEIASLVSQGMELHCGKGFPGIQRADLLVPSPGMPAGSPVLQEAVRRGIPVLSEIEVSYRISRAPIIAITGSNGKSTTTVLCGQMLQESGIRAQVGGNLAPGIPLVTLADRATDREVLVAEVSSFQLEWVETFRPRVACLLNISPEHLNRHPTMEEYAAIKARIAREQRGSDLAIFGNTFAEAYPDLLLGVGRHYRFCATHPVESGAYITGSKMRIVGRVDDVEGSLPDLSLDVSRFTLQGQHNLENAMAAALAALEVGARPEAIERALRSFRGLPHRMEFVGEVDGVRFVNNSMCTNPAAAVASLDAVSGSLVVITGGRSKGLEMRPFGNALAHRARWTVLIGETAPEMEGYLAEAGSREWSHAGGMVDAVQMAASHARPGDTVLLLPGYSSFDMFPDFEARGRAFTEAVREMAGRQPAAVGTGGTKE